MKVNHEAGQFELEPFQVLMIRPGLPKDGISRAIWPFEEARQLFDTLERAQRYWRNFEPDYPDKARRDQALAIKDHRITLLGSMASQVVPFMPLTLVKEAEYFIRSVT